MKAFKDTEYAMGVPENHVKFVELLCNYRAPGNKQTNFQERLEDAATMCEMDVNALDDGGIRELIHAYLSYYQYHSKYQLLLNYQITQWRIGKLFLEGIEEGDAEGLTKEITLMDKMTDLSWKLNQKIENLYSEIYGESEIIDIARDQVKKALSPEQRMKNRKKKEVDPLDV